MYQGERFGQGMWSKGIRPTPYLSSSESRIMDVSFGGGSWREGAAFSGP